MGCLEIDCQRWLSLKVDYLSLWVISACRPSQSGLYESGLSLQLANDICMLCQTRVSQSGLYQSGRSLWMAKYNYLCYLKLLGVSEWVVSECVVSLDG